MAANPSLNLVAPPTAAGFEKSCFPGLRASLLAQLEQTSFPMSYPQGGMLFRQGDLPHGVHILCDGRIKLSVGSLDGRSLIMKLGRGGELLGMDACLLGHPYDMTAEALEPCRVNFVPQAAFLRLARHDCEFALRIARHLSEQCHATRHTLGSIALSQSTEQKLAQLLLRMGEDSRGTEVSLAISHEQMAQMVGTSRETVTRALTRLRKAKVITAGVGWVRVCDAAGLRRIALGDDSPSSASARMPSAYGTGSKSKK